MLVDCSVCNICSEMTVMITEDDFGYVINNDKGKVAVKRFTLQNDTVKLQVINYGATITSLKVNARSKFDDIVLGYDTISCKLLSYFKHSCYYVMYFILELIIHKLCYS